MKSIKIIIILLFTILLAGCSKEYYLTVEDNRIIEEFDTVIEDNVENNERLNLNYYPLHADDETIYKKTIKRENNMLKVHFSYSYNPKKFAYANSINQCFEKKEVIVDNDKYYYFKLEGFKACISDYDLNINIITNNNVLTNNADKINGNTYTWYLKEDNKDNFNLEIKIEKGAKNNNANIISKIFIITLVFAIIIAVIVLLSKKRKSNNL